MKKIYFVFLMTLLPLLASAETVEVDGFTYEVLGDWAKVTRGPDRGNIVIPETITYNDNVCKVTQIGSCAFQSRSVTSVTIPNSVTTIHYRAFDMCRSLTSVTIPNSVTTIGSCAFQECPSLTSVNISDLTAWCKINFVDYNSNPLVYAHHLYLNGKEIKKLVIPSNVTSISNYAFLHCSNFTSITIPNSVKSIGNRTFYGCNNVTAVNISNLSAWCNYTFENWDCNPLSYAKHLYLNGKEIKDLVIPDDVQYIQNYAFYNCVGLTSVTIPRTVKGIYPFAFYDCIGLTSIKTMVRTPFAINKTVFSGSYDYAILYVPSGTASKYRYQDYWSSFDMVVEMKEDRPVIVRAKDYTIEYGDAMPKFDYTSEGGILEGEPSISCRASKTSPVGTYPIIVSRGNISNAGDVTLVNGTLTIVKAPLTVIGDDYTKYLGEKNPKFVPLYRGFKNKEKDDVLTVKPTASTKAKKTSPVGTYDVVFSGAKAKNYDIVEYVKGTLTIKDEAYFTEKGIKYANLFKNNTLEIIDNSGIRGDYEIQGTIKHNGINFTVTRIGNHAFLNSDLTSVIIPNSVTSIGNYAFQGSSLTSVKIPNSVTTIGRSAFHECRKLLSVDISKKVKSIGMYAFYGCSKLASVIIRGKPELKEYAFLNCDAITSITSYAEEPEGFYPDDKVFSDITYKNATLCVPSGTKNIYKKKTGWKLFKKIVDSAKVSLDKSEVTVKKGKTITLKATVSPTTLSDKSVTWKSSNTKVATVTKGGKVKGIKAGKATITCTSVATGAKATCKVIVGYVKLDKSEITVQKGKTVTLTATVYPSSLSDKSVTWKSSNTKIATVTSKGKVKGIKAGTATITCTSVATGLSTTCTVTVTATSGSRSVEGDDDDTTGIENLEEAPALAEPYDVYDLSGRKVLNQVNSLDGLPDGIYIVNGKKILKKK